MADAEPQRAFCHLEILQETGLSCSEWEGEGQERGAWESSEMLSLNRLLYVVWFFLKPPELRAEPFTQSP